MNLKELGILIKDKRESKNISLEDVSYAIKIPVKSLNAIEEGNLDYIGYETYYKNFLKCYVIYLGFTQEEYQEFLIQTEEFSEHYEPPKSLETQRAETQPEMTKPKGKKLAIQFFILAVIGGSVYFYITRDTVEKVITPTVEQVAQPAEPNILHEKESSLVEQQQETVIQSTENIVENKENNETSNSEQTDLDEKSKEEIVVSKEDLIKEEKEPEVKADKKEEVKQEEKKEVFDIVAFTKKYPTAKKINWEELSIPKQGEHQAVLYASQDCWMQYVLDGKKNHFILKRGAQKEFIFKKNLKLSIANGSAITLFLDKEPVTVGDSKQMREISLP